MFFLFLAFTLSSLNITNWAAGKETLSWILCVIWPFEKCIHMYFGALLFALLSFQRAPLMYSEPYHFNPLYVCVIACAFAFSSLCLCIAQPWPISSASSTTWAPDSFSFTEIARLMRNVGCPGSDRWGSGIKGITVSRFNSVALSPYGLCVAGMLHL